MSIASQLSDLTQSLQALSGAKTTIRSTLQSNGVTVPSNYLFSDIPALIGNIPKGWSYQYLTKFLDENCTFFSIDGLTVNPKIMVLINMGDSSEHKTALQAATKGTSINMISPTIQVFAQCGGTQTSQMCGAIYKKLTNVYSINSAVASGAVAADGRKLKCGVLSSSAESYYISRGQAVADIIVWVAGPKILTDNELIQKANQLTGTPSTLSLEGAEKVICTEIKGYNQNGVFTSNANGDITLTYFITTVKGWTIV